MWTLGDRGGTCLSLAKFLLLTITLAVFLCSRKPSTEESYTYEEYNCVPVTLDGQSV